MGLFGFGKKKAAAAAPDKKSTDFYTLCVEDYHNTIMAEGYAKNGLIFIPELIPIGEKTVLTFLQDNFFRMEFASNPTQYYFVITSLCIQAGVVFANMWHADFSKLKSGYVEQILAEGPADDAYAILAKEFGMDKNAVGEFCGKVYERWMAMHKPYWDLQDPREYTFKATLAAYQLGVSLILNKYGY